MKITSTEYIVVDAEQKVIAKCNDEDDALYIQQTINNHEKLKNVKRELRASDNWLHRLLKGCVIFLNDGEVTKRAVEKQSRYNQQALKEARKT